MDSQQFQAELTQLGVNASTAHRLLGISRASVYRIAAGRIPVPGVVIRLLDMYRRHGVPDGHRQ